MASDRERFARLLLEYGDARETPGTLSVPEAFRGALAAWDAQASALAEARETNKELHRRAQLAESALRERLAKPTDPRGFGRILANAGYAMEKARADEAEARLAALSAPSSAPGPAMDEALDRAALNAHEIGYQQGFREGVEAAAEWARRTTDAERSNGNWLASGIRALAAGSADTRTEGG